MEVSQMDVEVSKSMKRNSTAKPQDLPEGLEEKREGFIQKKPSWIVYKVLEEGKVQNKMFLDDKHCYNFDYMNSILVRAEMCKANTNEALKRVSEVIRWWIRVKLVLMAIFEEVFREQNWKTILQLNTKREIVRIVFWSIVFKFMMRNVFQYDSEFCVDANVFVLTNLES